MSEAKELREYIEKMVAAGLSRDGMLTRAADALAAKDAQIAALTVENERLRALLNDFADELELLFAGIARDAGFYVSPDIVKRDRSAAKAQP